MNEPGGPEPRIINGWKVYAHKLCIDQLETLADEVRAARERDPKNYARKNSAKRLAAILKLALEVIPQDPTRPEYRLGDTLGPKNRHWFRAKFFQQYRLFFRYSTRLKTIVLVWVNDEDTKRAYESKTGAYQVFSRKLSAGNPPDNWDELMREVKRNTRRFRKATERPEP